MRAHTKAVLGLAAVVVLGVATTDDEPPQATSTGAGRPAVDPPAQPAPPPAAEVPRPSSRPAGPPGTEEPGASRPRSGLLRPAGGGDGDSWRDTEGREYRLGLVNTPEHDECFGPEATAERKQRTAAGFHADVYAIDGYGRSVAVVTLADGTNLNVWLARQGYADDRYLGDFRAENPVLAAQLDQAFAAAEREQAGLWGACSRPATDGVVQLPAEPPAAPAQEPSAAGCHPDYLTCIPVQGDGSGAGAANDLDCGQIGQPVRLRQTGVDPYRLDREGDGVGCE
jgi:endonuclease YncB( thermonuclease family)